MTTQNDLYDRVPKYMTVKEAKELEATILRQTQQLAEARRIVEQVLVDLEARARTIMAWLKASPQPKVAKAVKKKR